MTTPSTTPGARFNPYIPPTETPKEFSVGPIILGVLLGGQSTQRTDLQEKMNESEGAPIQQTFKSTVELLPSGS